MTKELRERWNKFLENTRLYSAGQSDYYEFMENEIIEAKRRGRAEMRKECLDCIPPDNTIEFGKDEEYQRWHSEWTDARNHTIRTDISSL